MFLFVRIPCQHELLPVVGAFFSRMSEAAHHGRIVCLHFVSENIAMFMKVPEVHAPTQTILNL